MATRSPIERFWEKVQVSDSPDDACAVWTAHKLPSGYGMFFADGQNVMAHRWIYEYLAGPIPDGLEIDHTCRVRDCVNINHLEPVTHAENNRRKPQDVIRAAVAASAAARRAQTHCKHGHAFTPDNTYIRPGDSRECRLCAAARARARRARQKATS